MSKYRGPKLKITRRLGDLPAFTGLKKKSKKIQKAGKAGQPHKNQSSSRQDVSPKQPKKLTQYALRLEEKQKLKFNYGLTKKQLYNYVKEARRKKGVTGLILLQLLEMRLDSICFALGFGTTIGNARQIINHRYITVNGKIVNIPSFQCRINDVINIKEKTTSKNLVQKNLEVNKTMSRPTHMKFDTEKAEGQVINYCDRKSIQLKVDELLVIEYYSRR